MVRKEIVQNDNTDISIEVIKQDNDLVELSISYGNTPFSIMLDRDDVNALIDELAFANGPIVRKFTSDIEFENYIK
jgi:hypothetical protein